MKDLIETISDILLINEAFDRPYKWDTMSDQMYSFRTSDGRKFLVQFVSVSRDLKGSPVGVVFYDTSKSVPSAMFSKTGEGDQFRILSTVIDVILHYVKKFEPSEVEFEAEKTDGQENSRTKLYKKMVERFIRGTGYRLKVSDKRTAVSFALVRS
jgi:hypothetical protein